MYVRKYGNFERGRAAAVQVGLPRSQGFLSARPCSAGKDAPINAPAWLVLHNLAITITGSKKLVNHQPSEQRNREIESNDNGQKLIYALHFVTEHKHHTPVPLS